MPRILFCSGFESSPPLTTSGGSSDDDRAWNRSDNRSWAVYDCLYSTIFITQMMYYQMRHRGYLNLGLFKMTNLRSSFSICAYIDFHLDYSWQKKTERVFVLNDLYLGTVKYVIKKFGCSSKRSKKYRM